MSRLIIPSFQSGYARNAAEARYPQLWNGLVGAWMPALGPTGLTLHDVSGQHNNGTLTSMDPATDWVPTEKGWAVDLDPGSSQYVSVPGPQNLMAGATHATLVMLANRTAGTSTILGFCTTAPWRYELLHYTDNKVYCVASNGLSSYPNVLITTTGWIHYVLTFDGSLAGISRVKLYINGQLQTLVAGGVDPATSLASAANLGNFDIGYEADASRYTTGEIAISQLYSRTLDPNEIQLLYEQPHALTMRRPRQWVVPAAAPPAGVARSKVGSSLAHGRRGLVA